jgi:hypothetical protein
MYHVVCVVMEAQPACNISVMGEVSFVVKAGTVYKQDGTPMEVIAPGR